MTFQPLEFIISEYISYLEKDEDKRIWLSNKKTHEDIYVPLCKRGNAAYAHRLRKKLFDDDVAAALQSYFPMRRGWTFCVFDTLTYPTKKFSRTEAWESVSRDFNNYITKIRRKYGSVFALRCWESTEQGYPHVHVLLFFLTPLRFHFTMLKEKQRAWLSKSDWIFIQRCWKYYSFTEAVYNPVSAWFYLLKYITKAVDMNSEKDILTNALIWWYRLRGYSVSTHLVNLILSLTNSNESLWEFIMIIDIFSSQKIHDSIFWEWESKSS